MMANAPLNLWAQEGGILGLIIFMMFGVLVFLVRQLSKARQDSENFYDKINKDAVADRHMAMEERKLLNAEHGKNYNRLSDSLDRLADQLKKSD